MTKAEIMEKLANEGEVEKIIVNVTKWSDENLKDLAQDIYLSMLVKNNDKLIEKLYETGELSYYITKMVINNYFSKTSPYYKKYIEPQQHEQYNEDKY